MKVIFRSNNHFAKKSLRNNANVWVESLDKYLSEDAVLRLSLFVNQDNVAKASLNIIDKDLHVHATHEDVSFSVALESVVEKCAKQIVKKQLTDKSYREKVRYNDEFNSFESFNEDVELDSNIMVDYELIEAEKALEEKRNTSRYARVTNRYVDYLYGIKDIENEIISAENHLAILNNILATELDTMLYRDYESLIASIKQIETEIKVLNNCKNTYKMNIRDEAYVNEVIEEELNVLRLKRK